MYLSILNGTENNNHEICRDKEFYSVNSIPEVNSKKREGCVPSSLCGDSSSAGYDSIKDQN